MSKLMSDTKVLLTDVRLSYAHIFEPNSFNGGDPKYSTAVLIDKDDPEAIEVIEQAIEAAWQAGVNKGKWTAKAAKSVKSPLRDGDEDRPDDPNYENKLFFNANSKQPPAVVARYKDPETGKPVPLDENAVYSGCYVNITINFYPFSVSGNKGVAAGLGNIQKVRDGERLAGGSNPETDFEFDDLDDDDILG